LKEGDTNTHFFHIHANVRRRHKFIHSLEHDGHALTSEASKEEALFSFDDILGVSPQRSHSINLHLLDLPRCELLELSACFMEQEVWQVIRAMPPYKALGPDGFMPRFLQATWDIIKLEIMSAFNAFWYLGTRYFQEINGTLLVLLSKKSDASMIKNL
jgi:hypothetical protein